MAARDRQQYQDYLADLHYREYAYAAHDERTEKPIARVKLDLALWNDSIPQGVIELVTRKLARSVGDYRLAQDPVLIRQITQRTHYDVPQISIVAGADDALRVAAKYCIRPGDRALIPVPSFGRYQYHAYINEANVTFLPCDTYPYELDPNAIINRANKEQVSCIFIASPNNPTGAVLSISQLRLIVGSVKSMVILDESLLIDLKGKGHAELLQEFDNIVICGSFSKLYGLAGMRIGYIVTPAAHTSKVRQLISPFEVDSLSIELAKFMLSQRSWLRSRVDSIQCGITALHDISYPNLRVTNTRSPVALLECLTHDIDLYDALRAKGVLTVSGKDFLGLDNANAVRIIIKNSQDILRLQRILQSIL